MVEPEGDILRKYRKHGVADENLLRLLGNEFACGSQSVEASRLRWFSELIGASVFLGAEAGPLGICTEERVVGICGLTWCPSKCVSTATGNGAPVDMDEGCGAEV